MKKKMLVILGPTSTGKTDTGIFFAQKLGGEIISADSRQVYKFLDTGTGKLPGSFTSLKKGEGFWEIDGVKIWMYDVVFPSERFNLFEYLKKASEVAADLSSRNQLPIVVGGTGLGAQDLIDRHLHGVRILFTLSLLLSPKSTGKPIFLGLKGECCLLLT
jgi:tRNA dimethylallyltransferase